MKAKILITTVPFGSANRLPLDLLENACVDYVVNPLGRKLSEDDLCKMIDDYDILIAGTEIISSKVLDRSKKLKLISRVGVGLDGVDLNAARSKNISVSYTPDAPAPAVSELTIGLMFSLLRNVHAANLSMHRGNWNRFFGRRVSDVTVGIIGIGRIGSQVLNLVQKLEPKKILVNDLKEKNNVSGNIFWVDKQEIYENSDVITLHTPLLKDTQNMISYRELLLMKNNALLINTSRGGIVNEADLERALREGKIGGAAIDVFEQEPYQGNLAKLENCLLTSHMGSMSLDCRARMEIEATEEALRFINGEPLKNLVPEYEFLNQMRRD